MIYENLKLHHFRNYRELSTVLSPGTTVLYGSNGSGKTNLLEALHLLSAGRSHRGGADSEMVMSGEELAGIAADTLRLDGRHSVEIRLVPKEKPCKKLLLGGKPARRIGDLMGHATAVMFSPEDLRIVRDGPSARRRFVDMQLSQIRPAYLNALREYLRCLELRNVLLRDEKLIGVEHFDAQLDTWDEQLVRAAVPVIRSRQWFLHNLSVEAAALYASIAESPSEIFSLDYSGLCAQEAEPGQKLLEALQKTRREDVGRMFTWYGPHRDDVVLRLCGKDLRAYGSQGQLRTAVLSMKLGEIRIIRNEMGEPPALLLDDVFSELDVKRRSALLRGAEGIQTFITCTDRGDAAEAKADCFLCVNRDADGFASIRQG